MEKVLTKQKPDDQLPVDLKLNHNSKEASKEDWWKWSSEIWDPLLSQIFFDAGLKKTVADGLVTYETLVCPVCESNDIYAFFLAVRVNEKKTVKHGHAVYVGDRWWGCHSCQIQKRDRGELPDWLDPESVRWALDKFKERAERILDELL